MLARDVRIAMRAPVTWLVAALGALLVGHGFVLAIDIFTSGSRSVADSRLMAREFDPLLGIVRPTLGGLYIAASILVPVLAARPLAIEKERRSFRTLVHATAAPGRVIASKQLSAILAASILFVAPLFLLTAWRALGGHLALAETLTALTGYALYLVMLASIATAAAAWTSSLAQAATVTLVWVVISWAIDASDGFAALAWLGRAARWSVTTHLAPFEHGTLALDAVAWFAVVIGGSFGLALVGARFDLAPRRRLGGAGTIALGVFGSLALTSRIHTAFDMTESSRLSLPPAVVAGLRRIEAPIRLEVWLDRDDSRRRQAESDVLARLRLARPDVDIEMPLDRADVAAASHDEEYGRVVVRVGDRMRETRSTSRREITTLVFEAAGRPVPDNAQAEYPGHPLVIEGRARRIAGVLAYLVVPGALAAIGLIATRHRRRVS